MKSHFVYIMASVSGILYIGMTSNLARRIYEHKNELLDGFTKKYKCRRLVYHEQSDDVNSIIAREKQLKNWNRKKKIDLISRVNPAWKDLSADIT